LRAFINEPLSLSILELILAHLNSVGL
jgi:hypothetical protein